MKNIILCSSNPILVKSIYGVLRDGGHEVDITEHPAFAVQMVMHKHYDAVIVDSEPFGLSAEDAVEIIKTVDPEITVLFTGGSERSNPCRKEQAFDLEKFMKSIQDIAV